MTPNPTARPFVVGALLFLMLIGLWPGHATASAPAPVAGAVSTTPSR